jgi:hypothetical protein
MRDKPPRTYAQEILKMQSKIERTEALKKVPDNLKGLVRAHVVNAFGRKK